ncbi:hypothetical protein BKA61DRAFT_565586 [Leptodontidium sp. MPI-SDFR-AT-0119]|nr:hypothetical protein BKA61DRAFT_565586 [Leptodontidium sp. MPI-SDFR-AT-0119]
MDYWRRANAVPAMSKDVDSSGKDFSSRTSTHVPSARGSQEPRPLSLYVARLPRASHGPFVPQKTGTAGQSGFERRLWVPQAGQSSIGRAQVDGPSSAALQPYRGSVGNMPGGFCMTWQSGQGCGLMRDQLYGPAGGCLPRATSEQQAQAPARTHFCSSHFLSMQTPAIVPITSRQGSGLRFSACPCPEFVEPLYCRSAWLAMCGEKRITNERMLLDQERAGAPASDQMEKRLKGESW